MVLVSARERLDYKSVSLGFVVIFSLTQFITVYDSCFLLVLHTPGLDLLTSRPFTILYEPNTKLIVRLWTRDTSGSFLLHDVSVRTPRVGPRPSPPLLATGLGSEPLSGTRKTNFVGQDIFLLVVTSVRTLRGLRYLRSSFILFLILFTLWIHFPFYNFFFSKTTYRN